MIDNIRFCAHRNISQCLFGLLSLQSRVETETVFTLHWRSNVVFNARLRFFGRYSMNVITSCLFSVNMDPDPLIHFSSKMIKISPLLFTLQGQNQIFVPRIKTEICITPRLLMDLLYFPSLLTGRKIRLQAVWRLNLPSRQYSILRRDCEDDCRRPQAFTWGKRWAWMRQWKIKIMV